MKSRFIPFHGNMHRALSCHEGWPGIIFLATKTFKISFCIILCFCFQNQVSAADNLVKPNEPGPWPGLNINTYTGNFFYQRNDLFIPERGSVPFEVIFYYNSLKNYFDIGYGNGWSLSFNIFYSYAEDDFKVYRADGQEDIFTWNGSSFDPPPGIYDTITEYEAGKYLLTTKYGTKFYFDNNSLKKLTRTEDRNGNAFVFTYLDGDLSKVTGPSGRTLGFTWDAGHLVQITDTNTTPDRVITFEYDEDWNMTRVTRPLSNVYLYGYDESGKITSITDPRSNIANISYNANGAVETISCPAVNYTKTFTYDNCTSTTLISQVVSAVTRNTIHTFDLSGRVVSTLYPDSSRVSYAWDSQNNMTRFTNENGDDVLYTYDLNGNPMTETDCLTRQRSWTYEPVFNNITSFTDKRGNVTYYYYDAKGNLIQMKDCANNSEFYTVDSFGMLTALTDKNGSTNTYKYDPDGNLIRMVNSLGYRDSLGYDGVGNLLWHMNANNDTESYSFDLLDRTIEYVNFLGIATSFTPDENGNTVQIREALGKTTAFEFDALNRQTSVTDPSLGEAQTVYDEAGNPVSGTDETGCTTLFTYDRRNRLVKTEDCDGFFKTNEFDSAGYLLGFTDKNGKKTVYSNNCLGDPLSVTDPLGKTEYYLYDEEENITAHTDRNGSVFSSTFDCLNQLTIATDPYNKSERKYYDPGGRLVKTKDKTGDSTVNIYSCCRLTEVKNALGIPEKYEYNPLGNRTKLTDRNGNSWLTYYNAQGQIDSTINPLGDKTAFEYDSLGRLRKKTDENGNIHETCYDLLDRIVCRINPALDTFKYSYNAAGDLLYEINWNGDTTFYSYSSRHDLLTKKNPSGGIIGYTYDGFGSMASQTDELGNTWLYAYDALNRDSLFTNPDGGEEIKNYDNNGNLIIVTNENGFSTNMSYDLLNREIKVKHASGDSVLTAYDPDNNKVSETDGNGNTTYYTYDKDNRLISINDAMGGSIGRSYDSVGNVRTETDQNGKTTRYTYDGMSRLLTTKDRMNGITASAYDPKGNRLTFTDASGNVTAYSYDELDRIVMMIGPVGDTTIYGYDAGDNLVSETDAILHTRYNIYDADDRLLYRINALGDTTKHIYDAGGNPISETNPAGAATLYSFDPLHQIDTITDPLGFTRIYIRDDMGNILESIDEDGNSTLFTYDPDDRLTGVTNAIGGVKTSGYDKNGNKISEEDELGNPYYFVYDELDRLVEEINPDGSNREYGYDPAGRLISEKDGRGGEVKSFYDDLGRRINRINELGDTAKSTFDAVGNQLTFEDETGATWTYVYDAANRLVKIILPSGNEIVFVYDKAGNLIRKTDASGKITNYGYDEENRLISESVGRSSGYTITLNPNGAIEQIGSGETGTKIYRLDKKDQDTCTISISDYGADTVWTARSGTGAKTRIIAGGDTIARVFDGMSHVTYEDLNGLGTTSDYNLKAQKTAVAYSNGAIAQYSYDENGNEKTFLLRTYLLDTLQYVFKRHNENGYVDSSAYFDGSYLLTEYDSANRVIRDIFVNPAAGTADSTFIEYDPDGNVHQTTHRVTYNPASLKFYIYDTDRFLVQIVDSIESPGTRSIETTDYINNEDGHRIFEVSSSGDTTKHYWDDFDQYTGNSDPWCNNFIEYNLAGEVSGIDNCGYAENRIILDGEGNYQSTVPMQWTTLEDLSYSSLYGMSFINCVWNGTYMAQAMGDSNSYAHVLPVFSSTGQRYDWSSQPMGDELAWNWMVQRMGVFFDCSWSERPIYDPGTITSITPTYIILVDGKPVHSVSAASQYFQGQGMAETGVSEAGDYQGMLFNISLSDKQKTALTEAGIGEADQKIIQALKDLSGDQFKQVFTDEAYRNKIKSVLTCKFTNGPKLGVKNNNNSFDDVKAGEIYTGKSYQLIFSCKCVDEICSRQRPSTEDKAGVTINASYAITSTAAKTIKVDFSCLHNFCDKCEQSLTITFANPPAIKKEPDKPHYTGLKPGPQNVNKPVRRLINGKWVETSIPHR